MFESSRAAVSRGVSEIHFKHFLCMRTILTSGTIVKGKVYVVCGCTKGFFERSSELRNSSFCERHISIHGSAECLNGFLSTTYFTAWETCVFSRCFGIVRSDSLPSFFDIKTFLSRLRKPRVIRTRIMPLFSLAALIWCCGAVCPERSSFQCQCVSHQESISVNLPICTSAKTNPQFVHLPSTSQVSLSCRT